MSSYKRAAVTMFLCLALGCVGGDGEPHDAGQEWTLDQRSYDLGAIGAFSEMVESGVKRLALSAPLAPAEMDAMIDEATRIAAAHNVEVFRETDFPVTDLFSAEITEGKHVLVICRSVTLQAYEAMKEERQRLLDQGEYHGVQREEIARRFGELLSYPDEQIDRLLANANNN